MKCPHCGKEVGQVDTNSARFSIVIDDRLTKYGYPERNQAKYNATIQVRSIVKIRAGIDSKAKDWSNVQYDRAMKVLDEVLPEKKD